MKIKLLHIGLGKCGSTFLQKEIFPEIEKQIGVKLININDYIKVKKNKNHILKNLTKLEKKLPHSFIYSDEGLVSNGGEFSNIQKSFNLIKKNFSPNTIILIVIRDPYEFLNSMYCQKINEMDIIRPENFFYNKKSNILRYKGRYNLDQFDYKYLITTYKSYFKKVIIVKYENLHKLIFLKKIFNFDNTFLKQLKKKRKNLHNRSISKFGINTILFLNKFINIKKSHKFLKKYLSKNPKTKIEKIKYIIFREIYLRDFFQNRFDKIIKYKKYYLEKKTIPIDINKQIKIYQNLKDCY